MNRNHLTQAELAKELSMDEALVSKIVHYHFEEFTSDRLIKCLSVLYPNVDVHLLVA